MQAMVSAMISPNVCNKNEQLKPYHTAFYSHNSKAFFNPDLHIGKAKVKVSRTQYERWCWL